MNSTTPADHGLAGVGTAVLESGLLEARHADLGDRADLGAGDAHLLVGHEEPAVVEDRAGPVRPVLAAAGTIWCTVEFGSSLLGPRGGLAAVRDDAVCRRLMTVPGVGPVVSLAFTATIDIPERFKNSKAVGPASG